MRIILLRSLCILSLCLCMVGGTLKGIYQQKRMEQQVASYNDVTHQAELEAKQSMIEAQAAKIEQLKQIVSQALAQEYIDQPLESMQVTATAYSARKEECNAQPWITASGTPSRVGVVAVSRDLEELGVQLGDFVIIKGMGLFRVEDRMNKRWKKRIDILHANVEAARIFSKRKVEIMWLRDTQLAKQAAPATGPVS